MYISTECFVVQICVVYRVQRPIDEVDIYLFSPLLLIKIFTPDYDQ